MASGRRTLREIEGALAQLSDAEQRTQLRVDELTTSKARILEQRTGQFRELAEQRARDALSDGVIDEADRLQHRVATVLTARTRTIGELKKSHDRAEREHTAALRKAEALADELASLEQQLDAFAEQARKELSGNADYAAVLQQRMDLGATYKKAAAKADQAEEDRRKKGEPYQEDPLFMYLWKREYGTRGYRGTTMPLIRWLDGKVADLVGYHSARANYAILTEIPVRLKKHADTLAGELEAANARVEAIETEKIRQLAGIDFPQTLAVAREREKRLNDHIAQLAAEMVELSNSLNVHANGEDPAFREAVELAAGFLEKESMGRLRRMARTTLTPTDDEIVERIAKLESEVSDIEKQIGEAREDLEKIARRRREMVKVAGEFRRANYDDPGSYFSPDTDLEDILELQVRGAISGAEYWSRAQSRHRWRSRPADVFRQRSGFPPFGGRGRSRGGFRTSGGF
jgi:chromosome segregation ATPase